MKVETIQQKYNQIIKEKIFKQFKKNSDQKKQLRLICIQNEFKIIKSTFFNWQLAYLRKQREAEIEQKGYNKYLRKLKKKLFLMLQLNLMFAKEKRNKYSQAKLFYEKRILKKSLYSLKLNEAANKQTFLEKMKRIDEQDQIYQNCQQSMRQNLIAEAFYKQQLQLKYLRKWKQYIFKTNSHYNSYNLGQKLHIIDLNDNEKDKQQNETNKQSQKNDINQLLECKIQFYEKNKQLLNLYQKEIIKKEIKELLLKKNV